MASFTSVTAFATRAERYVRDDLGWIDVAIMNAGMASGQWHVTEDRWERTIQVNGLSTAGPAERYAVSKLLDVYIMLELARMVPRRENAARTPLVVVNAVTPRFCKSELLTREKTPVVLRAMQWLTGRTTQEGGKALVDAAVRGVDSHGGWLENQVVAE